MSKRKASIVLALVWMTVVMAGLLAAARVHGAEQYVTAEVTFDADGAVVKDRAGNFLRRQKREPDEPPRTEPYDPNTAPIFDFPGDTAIEQFLPEGTSLSGLLGQIDLGNIMELIMPLLALFGGFQMGTSKPSVKMFLTLISKLKKDQFGEIIKDFIPKDDPEPDPDSPAPVE